MEFIHDLLWFKFDGKNTTIVLGYATKFVQFCFLNGFHLEEIFAWVFNFSSDGHVKQWCYSLPITSITCFDHLVNDLYLPLDKYEYQDVIDEIDQFRMEFLEPLENFIKRFLHICY